MARNPFRGPRFPQDVILCAVRWYCRYGLSYRDVRDLLAERGITVDASTVYRWVRKFGPEIAKRSQKHRGWRGLGWHVDETYLRVGGRWCYVWRAVDQRGRLIDFRVTARRNTAAAKAFIRQARDKARLYPPLSIVTNKAPTYAKVMKNINAQMLPNEAIMHIDQKWQNNRIESDHAALKQRLNPMRGFKTLSSAKAALAGIEAVRMIKKGHVVRKSPGPIGEIRFIEEILPKAA
ncbi:transposase [Parvularcula bermudensis HTCC2503]|uniref:Transposase n=1 Tax=Parvularcula bermudensis (strain ATCC BAA-594 / HTCC2503 / KCTC 12087) TaxID=314260 RepID=E0THK9_PARBH|nr:IS6 family transposase [Parvularcula bermudensis]ADM09305.1 transposase [Parvularcula bermudensis HTCC2503]